MRIHVVTTSSSNNLRQQFSLRVSRSRGNNAVPLITSPQPEQKPLDLSQHRKLPSTRNIVRRLQLPNPHQRPIAIPTPPPPIRPQPIHPRITQLPCPSHVLPPKPGPRIPLPLPQLHEVSLAPAPPPEPAASGNGVHGNPGITRGFRTLGSECAEF